MLLENVAQGLQSGPAFLLQSLACFNLLRRDGNLNPTQAKRRFEWGTRLLNRMPFHLLPSSEGEGKCLHSGILKLDRENMV